MMGSCSDVVEISSEDEEASNTNKLGSKLGNESDDFLGLWDDLVIMDELPILPPKKAPAPATVVVSDDDVNCVVSVDGSGCGADDDNDDDDDDDDCLVLDHDPDKPVVAAAGGSKVDDDSDEIEIVGAKGEVACRDFPHPRHLCANFPFNTTSHDKYCKMCHCYVCDSPAPCSLWGSLVDFNSHCHATDKIPMWKKLRDSNKAPSLQKTIPQIVTSRTLPTWRSVPHNSYAPYPNQRSRPTSIQIPSCRSNIGPITTGSMHSHRSGPYHPVRSNQLTRSSSMRDYSSNITKQSAQPFCPVLNAHQTQPSPVLHQSHSMSNESLLRSLNAVQNSTMQRLQSQPSMPAQVTRNMNIPAASARTQMNLQGNLTDLASKSWQDIIDCVAIELGVSDYSANTSGVQQPLNTVLPTRSGALDCAQAGNMPAHARSMSSTVGQSTANLDANGTLGIHDDVFEALMSPQLEDFNESWMCAPEFS